MRKGRYSESQIYQILNEGESGKPIGGFCRDHGIGNSVYYKWKAKYWGMDVNELKHLRESETKNRRQKQMYAELNLDHKFLMEIVSKMLLSPEHPVGSSRKSWF